MKKEEIWMFKHTHPFEIPRDELLWIDPQTRKTLFYNMLDNYRVYCPNLTLEYAYLNFNSKLPFDYTVVFSGRSTTKERIMAWKCAYVYSWDSIPGYRYVVREGKHAEFFDDQMKTMCRISRGRFNEFIQMMCQLSLNEQDESYWKSPYFAETLLDNLSELSLRYTPPR